MCGGGVWHDTSALPERERRGGQRERTDSSLSPQQKGQKRHEPQKVAASRGAAGARGSLRGHHPAVGRLDAPEGVDHQGGGGVVDVDCRVELVDLDREESIKPCALKCLIKKIQIKVCIFCEIYMKDMNEV